MELVKFDTQLMENPEIYGIAYQHGELGSGSFNVTTTAGTIQGISHRYCRVIHRADGYGINRAGARSQNPSPPKPLKMAAVDGVSF
jgi:hypothetical protein